MAQLKTGSTVNSELIITNALYADYNLSTNVVDFSLGYNIEIDIVHSTMLYSENLQIGQYGIIKINNNAHFKVTFSEMYKSSIKSTISPSGITLLKYNIISSTEINLEIIEGQNGWNTDISGFTYNPSTINLATYEGSLRGVSLNSTGTKMYVVGTAAETVYEYNLHIPWDIKSITDNYNSFYVGGTLINPSSLYFKSDGSKLYLTNLNATFVYEYDLGVAWDVTSMVYIHNKAIPEETTVCGVSFKSDGFKMYTTGPDNDRVFEYDLSVAWDVSSVVYNSVSFLLTGQILIATDVQFNNDGTKMYVADDAADTIFEYDLSTAWLVSSAVYNSVNKNISTEETNITGIHFSSDGTKMYMVGTLTDSVYEYDLSVAWDLSTCVYTSPKIKISNEDSSPTSICFNGDGSKMYMIGNLTDDAFQYTLSTPWDITTCNYDSVTISLGQDTNPYGIDFNHDGTKMYVIGIVTNKLFQYDLSVAWDISTVIYSGLFLDITTQDGTPLGFTFKSDGTKVYVLGGGTDDVFEYKLSTAWDVSTGSYNINYPIAEDTNPYGIVLSPDGTKMYILGYVNDTVYQYTLSTPWLVSSATYDSVFKYVAGQDGTIYDIKFNTNATKMYIIGYTNGYVYEYNL